MRKIFYLLLASSSLFLASCTKEEDDIDLDASNTALLQQEYWRLTSMTFNPDINNVESVIQDAFQYLNDCYTDNVWAFPNSTDVNVDEYYLKCNINDPQVHNYKFNIQNDSYLRIYTNPDDMNASILIEGKIVTETHDKFFVEHEYWEENTERTVRVIRGFEKFTY